MKLKKVVLKILAIGFFLSMIISNYISTYGFINMDKAIKASVLLYTYEDKYINKIKKELEDKEKDNKNKINFEFYNSNKNQDLQNKQIDEILENGTDIIILNIVDINSDKYLIDKIKEKNIPVIFFNREPTSLVNIKSYGKAVFIGNDSEEAGKMQGEIIKEVWEKNKKIFDRNNDNTIQYILIEGEKNNIDTELRSEYVIQTLNRSNINTLKIASEFCNWDRDYAKNIIKSFLLQYGTSIEAIICNNDEMAIGGVLALRELGYGPSDKKIIVGVDGTDEAIQMVKDGEMAGTVVQDPHKIADAIYKLAINMSEGKNPLENTEYNFDNTGTAIRIPYSKYMIDDIY